MDFQCWHVFMLDLSKTPVGILFSDLFLIQQGVEHRNSNIEFHGAKFLVFYFRVKIWLLKPSIELLMKCLLSRGNTPKKPHLKKYLGVSNLAVKLKEQVRITVKSVGGHKPYYYFFNQEWTRKQRVTSLPDLTCAYEIRRRK